MIREVPLAARGETRQNRPMGIYVKGALHERLSNPIFAPCHSKDLSGE